MSRFYDTVPVGAAGPQPLFLNAAAVGKTPMPARELLEAMLAVEQERGRERPYQNAPRSLDLDLILYGDAVIDEPALVVPHPRFRERRFVLEPLAEIAPDLKDPVTGHTWRPPARSSNTMLSCPEIARIPALSKDTPLIAAIWSRDGVYNGSTSAGGVAYEVDALGADARDTLRSW